MRIYEASTKQGIAGTIEANMTTAVDFGGMHPFLLRNLGPEVLYIKGMDGDVSDPDEDMDQAFPIYPGEKLNFPASNWPQSPWRFFCFTTRGTTRWAAAGLTPNEASS